MTVKPSEHRHECRFDLSCVYPKHLIHITPITVGVCRRDGSDGGYCSDTSQPCNAGLTCVMAGNSRYGFCVKNGDEGSNPTGTVDPTVSTSKVSATSDIAKGTVTVKTTVKTSKIYPTDNLVKGDATVLSGLSFAGFIAWLFF